MRLVFFLLFAQTWRCSTKCFTCVSAVSFVGFIHAIKNPVTAVRVGPAAPFITFKGEVAAVVVRWRYRIILDAVSLIVLKLHSVRTSTNTGKGRCWEAEVTAETVGHHVTPAGEG